MFVSDSPVQTANPATAVTQAQIEQSPEPKLVVNELLFFVSNKFDCLARDVIRPTIADFYREPNRLSCSVWTVTRQV